MDDLDKWWLGDEYPCKNYDRRHLNIECHTIKKNGLCAPTQSFGWIVCHVYGGKDGHWNGCPRSYSPPLNPYYDSSVIYDIGRSDDMEDAE